MPKAAAMRTRSAAVGLVMPRSIVLSIAFETPDRSASSASDQSRMRPFGVYPPADGRGNIVRYIIHSSIITKFSALEKSHSIDNCRRLA